jgi:hypothetical protein
MKTKAQIVQELLDSKKINAEEAVTLLMGTEKEYVYLPQPYPVYPSYPVSPLQPLWQSPFTITCRSVVN